MLTSSSCARDFEISSARATALAPHSGCVGVNSSSTCPTLTTVPSIGTPPSSRDATHVPDTTRSVHHPPGARQRLFAVPYSGTAKRGCVTARVQLGDHVDWWPCGRRRLELGKC